MGRTSLTSGHNAAVLALEAHADRARLALACAYSSSDEFEADMITARRQARTFGPRKQWQAIAAVLIATALLAVSFAAFTG